MTKVMRKSMLALMSVGVASAMAFAPLALADSTTENEIVDEPEEDPIADEGEGELPEEDTTPAAPKTADSTVNTALAIGATAVVAALGMTFVLKKVRG